MSFGHCVICGKAFTVEEYNAGSEGLNLGDGGACFICAGKAVKAVAEIAAREATHQLAAYYELLLVRLQGEPTDHGDCPVAKYIDKLEIRIAHLTSTVTTLRAKRAAEAAMEGD
jgi:hypothetical protein